MVQKTRSLATVNTQGTFKHKPVTLLNISIFIRYAGRKTSKHKLTRPKIRSQTS